MQILLGVFFLLSVCSVLAKKVDKRLIELVEPETNSIEDAMVYIIKTCFPHFKNIVNMANLTENSRSKYIFDSLQNSELVTISIDLNSNPQKKVRLHEEADVVIANAKRDKTDNLHQLESYEMFHLFTKSLLFLINDKRYDCKWSLNNLNETQNRQFVKTYFFCIESKKIYVYTHIPKVKWAPSVWKYFTTRDLISNKNSDSKKKKGRRHKNDSIFIYKRPFSKDNICQDFIYDVSHLPGYPLTIAALGKQYDKPYLDTKLSMILEKVFKLSEKPSVQRLSHSQVRKLMRKNTYDIFLERQQISSNNITDEIYTVTFPIAYYSIVIVTNNRGLMSPLEKIFNYYGYLVVVSTTIILAITFVVIYSHTHNFTFAIFEILRLLINNEIYTSMKTTSIRIFFATIFLYFLVIHGTFSGRLAEFLTRNEYRKNVETLEDLKDPLYTRIFTYKQAVHYIHDPQLRSKTNFKSLHCKEQIQNNASVACINDLITLLPIINELELHQPKKVLHTGFYVQLVRKNSPFATKINNLMISLMHSGLAQKWTNDKIADEMRGIKIKEARALINYRPIDFSDLFFSFVLLGVGLFCSAVCFIVEFLINKFVVRQKQKRARGRWMIPKVMVRLKRKTGSDYFEVEESFHFRRGRNIARCSLRSFIRYLLRHW